MPAKPLSFPIGKGHSVSIDAPGLTVSLAPAPVAKLAAKAMKPKYTGDEEAALSAAGLEEIGKPLLIAATPRSKSKATMGQFGSNDAHVVTTVTSAPFERILVRAENRGVVQWYLPHMEPAALKTKSATPQVTARFVIPSSMLQPSVKPGIKGKGAASAILRFFKFKIVPELIGAATSYLLQWIAEKVEAKLKKEGVKEFARPHYPMLTWQQLDAMRGRPVLLLIHGIFSSVGGAFGALHGTGALSALEKKYPGRIIGFDHWTVAKTPLENAKHLMSLLPPGLELDIMCHSRGGLITRSILEHPDPDLVRLRSQQKFRKAFFAAGANQGSALARRANWNRLLNVFFAMASVAGPNAVGVSLKLLVEVLKVLAHGASRLPSIEALRPNLAEEPNTFLAELNGDLSPDVTSYAVVHANFDQAQSVLLNGIDLGIDFLFENVANDLVVPFEGAAEFDPHQPSIPIRERAYGNKTSGQGVVYHTVYFEQPGVQQLIQEFF